MTDFSFWVVMYSTIKCNRLLKKKTCRVGLVSVCTGCLMKVRCGRGTQIVSFFRLTLIGHFMILALAFCFLQRFRHECKLMNKLVETHLERIQTLMRICWQWKPDQSHCHQALIPETLKGRWEGWPEQFLMDKKNIIYYNGQLPLLKQSLTQITFN